MSPSSEAPKSVLSMFKSLQSAYPAPPPCPADLETGPPSFIGVGTMRSGTTWWHDLIRLHPQGLFFRSFFGHMFPSKERHFFDRFCKSEFSARDAQEYQQWFPRPSGRLVGEWTPSYMLDHWIPALLKVAAPEARLLVMLRDPVERYLSGMTFQIQQGETRTTTELAREQMTRSLYSMQLNALLRSFDRKQVLVLQYERCRADPETEIKRTYRFLGIDDSFLPASLTAPRNSSEGERFHLDPVQRTGLARLYAESTHRVAADFPEIDLALWPSAKAGGV